MKVEIAEHGRMSESGSSLLRLIQNQDMPLLDLLVRESVQNSLDAANGNAPDVKVSFNIGQFQSKNLNKHFEKIQNALNSRFPSSNGAYDYVAVADANTYGLTGPVNYDKVVDNKFGNLLKLVYEICKPQQNEGAGGSWGLGKTIFFRVGIGLVIYYSRIFQDGKYRSRLAACLVEDETKTDALIPYSGGVKRGIAWWGESAGKNKTVPIENEKEIKNILSVFGIAPYSGKDTGTTVIIPYINKQALLDEVYARNEESDQKPYWAKSVSEYLRVALQKWYAPRISNSYYAHGAYLSAYVNNQKIKASSMLPLFRVVRELYILAADGTLEDNAILSAPDIDKYVDSIDLRKVFRTGQSAGKFAYAKLSTSHLLMEAPDNNKSPYQQITNCVIPMEGGNVPIIMYTRRPSMVVGYDFDGPWTHRMPKTAENKFVIGLFVINSVNQLKDIRESNDQPEISLEEYIRKGEKADHASWADRNIRGNNPRIVTNIQKGIFRKITAKYSERTADNTTKKNIGLGHALANILLPSSDFGRAATQPPTPGGNKEKPQASPKRKSSISLLDMQYHSDCVTVDFDIFIKKHKCNLSLLLLTDFQKYSADKWEDENEIGKPFPLEFVSFSITSTKATGKNAKESEKSLSVSKDSLRFEDESISAEILLSKCFQTASTVQITSSELNISIRGTMKFKSSDLNLKGIFDLKEV